MTSQINSPHDIMTLYVTFATLMYIHLNPITLGFMSPQEPTFKMLILHQEMTLSQMAQHFPWLGSLYIICSTRSTCVQAIEFQTIHGSHF